MCTGCEGRLMEMGSVCIECESGLMQMLSACIGCKSRQRRVCVLGESGESKLQWDVTNSGMSLEWDFTAVTVVGCHCT